MLARVIGTLTAPPQARTFPPISADTLPELRGRLEVIRDRNGVWHLYADHEPDCYAAMGFAQASDRFLLIDAIRHLGAGRLVALVGKLRAPKRHRVFNGRGVADIDAFVRPLGFEAQSRADFTRLSPRAAALLEAFAAGVNAALRAMRGCYPPEYLFAGRVRPWHPADCLLAAQTCAFVVSLTAFENELTFDAVRGALGDAAARRLYPDAPWENAPSSYAARGPLDEPEVPIHVHGSGSNNWAVGPSRSQSGAPVVANDPHVPFLPLPTFWHHVHLECPAYRVQGGALPGCPVFGFGHNGSLAWGCTTGYRDGYDLYRIHRVPDDPTRYRTARGSGAITKHRERMGSHLGRPLTLEWESCEHGVLYPGWRHHDGVDLAMRAIPSDLAHYFEGYVALAASRTVEEHRAALALMNDGPFDFNHVYGHRDGAIGWELFGRLPRRRRDGLFVRDAHDPDAQWGDWVPFHEMPKHLDPPSGFVASANSATDPQAHSIAFTLAHCEPRYRNDRIDAVLAATSVHTVETFAALQRDVFLSYGPALRDALVEAIGAITGNAVAAHALEQLQQWDGTFAVEAASPALVALMQHDLTRRLFGPLLGARIGPRYAEGRRALPRLHRLLLDCNDPLRADIAHACGRPVADLVREAFFAAVRRLAAAQGADPSRWRWGAVQRVRLGTLLSLVPGLGARFVALDAEFPGDEYTVSPARSIPFRGMLYAFVGATSRFVCDLSRPDEALFAHSTGPSADPSTAFFANLSGPWQRFEYFRSALWKPDDVPDPVERIAVDRRAARR